MVSWREAKAAAFRAGKGELDTLAEVDLAEVNALVADVLDLDELKTFIPEGIEHELGDPQ